MGVPPHTVTEPQRSVGGTVSVLVSSEFRESLNLANSMKVSYGFLWGVFITSFTDRILCLFAIYAFLFKLPVCIFCPFFNRVNCTFSC